MSRRPNLIHLMVFLVVVVIAQSPDSPAANAGILVPADDCVVSNSAPADYDLDLDGPAFWGAVALLPSSGDVPGKALFVYEDAARQDLRATGQGPFTGLVVFRKAVSALYPSVVGGTQDYLFEHVSSSFDLDLFNNITAQAQGTVNALTPEACGQVHLYRLEMIPGGNYEFELTRNGTADVRMALFVDPNDGPDSQYMIGRLGSKFEALAGSGKQQYRMGQGKAALVVFSNTPYNHLGSPTAFTVTVTRKTIDLPRNTCQPILHVLPADFSIVANTPRWAGLLVMAYGDTDFPPSPPTMSLWTGEEGTGTELVQSPGQTRESNLIVGDFNDNPSLQQFYPRLTNTDPSNVLGYMIQWEAESRTINMSSTSGFSANLPMEGVPYCTFLEIWSVYLESGELYRFNLSRSDTTFGVNLSLFKNAGGSTHWAGRGDSEFEIAAGDPSHIYLCTQSDWYGLFVFKDPDCEGPVDPCLDFDAAGWRWGTFSLSVSKQGSVEALPNEDCQVGDTVPQHYVLDPYDYSWAAFAVNSSQGDDKNISLYTAPWPNGDALAFSTSTSSTDYVIGDFHANSFDSVFPLVSNGSAAASYTSEWVNDAPEIDVPIGSPIHLAGNVGGTTGDCGLVNLWNLNLNAGRTYDFEFIDNPGDDAVLAMALHQNLIEGQFWAGRNAGLFELTEAGGGFTQFDCQETATYGLIVFNDGPGSPSGFFDLFISDLGSVDVGDGVAPAGQFYLGNPFPNPVHGREVSFDLRLPDGQSGPITVSIHSVSGRQVRVLHTGTLSSGTHKMNWDGTDSAGSRVAPGIYFARAKFEGASLVRKIIVLE